MGGGVQLNVNTWGWSDARGSRYPTASTDRAWRVGGCDMEVEMSGGRSVSAAWLIQAAVEPYLYNSNEDCNECEGCD